MIGEGGQMLRSMPGKTEARGGPLIARRGFIASLTLACVAAPSAVIAQTSAKTFRVGHLFGGGRTSDGLPPLPLRDALRELGYVEGRNVTYEARFAEGRIDQLPALA